MLKINEKKQSSSAAKESVGLDCGPIRLW